MLQIVRKGGLHQLYLHKCESCPGPKSSCFLCFVSILTPLTFFFVFAILLLSDNKALDGQMTFLQALRIKTHPSPFHFVLPLVVSSVHDTPSWLAQYASLKWFTKDDKCEPPPLTLLFTWFVPCVAVYYSSRLSVAHVMAFMFPYW